MRYFPLILSACAQASEFYITPLDGASRYRSLTFPHINLGIGNQVQPMTNVEVWPVDCVYLQCTPCPSGRRLGHGGASSSCFSSGGNGRMLGHGGGAAAVTAPVGWFPDPTANNTDFCDLRTMIGVSVGTGTSSGRMLGHGAPAPGSRRVVGYIFFGGWFLTCALIPRTNQAFVHAKKLWPFRSDNIVVLLSSRSSNDNRHGTESLRRQPHP